MRYLKQSTQVIVMVGVFTANGAHDVPDTGVTLAGANDAELVKHQGGAVVNISGRTFAHIQGGHYNLTLTTGDTDTLGMLRIFFREQGEFHLLSHDFMVMPANVYDSMFGADKLQVDTVEISGSATAADNAELDYTAPGYTKTNSAIGAVGACGIVTAALEGQVIRKNVALTDFEFAMFNSLDNKSPITGRTVTAKRSIDGAAFAAAANSATIAEVGLGVYKIDLDAADLNGDVVTFEFVASGASNKLITFITQA